MRVGRAPNLPGREAGLDEASGMWRFAPARLHGTPDPRLYLLAVELRPPS